MIIDSFEKSNDDEWQARVHFATDPMKTTMSFPISHLIPVISQPKEKYHVVSTVH